MVASLRADLELLEACRRRRRRACDEVLQAEPGGALEARRVAGHRRRHRSGRIAAHDAAGGASALRLALGRDGGRSGAAEPRHDLRRRSDRRHARLHRRRRPLVREPCPCARRPAGGGGAERAGARRIVHGHRRGGSLERRLPGSPYRPRPTFAGARLAGPRGWLKTDAVAAVQAALEAHVPSLAYRFAMVAAGRLDAAFASPRANDWDLAAADLLVHEAGGRLTDLEGGIPRYNREVPRHQALAAANAALHPALLAIVRAAEQEVARSRPGPRLGKRE